MRRMGQVAGSEKDDVGRQQAVRGIQYIRKGTGIKNDGVRRHQAVRSLVLEGRRQ